MTFPVLIWTDCQFIQSSESRFMEDYFVLYFWMCSFVFKLLKTTKEKHTTCFTAREHCLCCLKVYLRSTTWYMIKLEEGNRSETKGSKGSIVWWKGIQLFELTFCFIHQWFPNDSKPKRVSDFVINFFGNY